MRDYKSFDQFLAKHRFKIHHLPIDGFENQVKIRLMQTLFNNQTLYWHLKTEEYRKLSTALALASYMSNYDNNDPEGFARATSLLNDEEWIFALSNCGYHKIKLAIENLNEIEIGMNKEYINLRSSFAKIETDFHERVGGANFYKYEMSKAQSYVRNFSALYGLYVDTCRRIKKFCNIGDNNSYKRAILRVLGENCGMHSFLIGLRNYQLHYGLLKISFKSDLTSRGNSEIYLNSSDILYSGFDWGRDAKIYLSTSKEIDVIKLLSESIKDIRGVIRFHRKIVNVNFRNEGNLYEAYLRERRKFKQLHAAVFDMGAVFRSPTSILSRLLDKDFVSTIIESDLTDYQVSEILFSVANRYKNIDSKNKEKIKEEIGNILKSRTKYENSGSYLMGRKHA